MRGFPSGFYQNISSLVLALVLALLVWITVTNLELEQMTFPSRPPYIQIELINQPEGLIVAEVDQEVVQIDLRISKDEIRELQKSDLIAEADLSDLEPGVMHQVEVKVRSQPLAPRVHVLDVIPNRINVRLDQVVTKTIQVETRIKDESTVPQTAQVLTNTVEPLFITIKGPQSLVDSIERIFAEAKLDGASESVELQVKPQLIGLPNNADLSTLTMNPEYVTVKVEIEQRPGYRDLIVTTDLKGEPESGYWVSELSVQPQLVTVVGKPSIILGLDGLAKTEPIDITDLTDGEFIRDTRLQLPEGISPLQDSFVQVNIKIEPQTSRKRFRMRPTVTGLDAGLLVEEDAIIPSLVNVLITGSVIELEELNLDDIAITLDATDLSPGPYRLEPKVKPPGSLKVESVNPELIEITIEQEQISRQIEVPIKVTESFSNTLAIVTPERIRLDLKGPPSLIEQLEPEKIELLVDATSLKAGRYQIIPNLSLNKELTLDTPLQPVNVTVYDKEDLIILLEQVKIVNLAKGLRGTLSVGVIELYVMGPGGVETLSENEEFSIEVDLANLSEGTHMIRPNINLPSAYSLVNATPKQLEITLEQEDKQ